jgi:hypothetical protein
MLLLPSIELRSLGHAACSFSVHQREDLKVSFYDRGVNFQYLVQILIAVPAVFTHLSFSFNPFL